MGLKVTLLFIVLLMIVAFLFSTPLDKQVVEGASVVKGIPTIVCCPCDIVQQTQVAGAGPYYGNGTCSSSYQVQSGDAMYKIANRCGIPVSALIAANPQITNPNRIYPGNILIIPVGQPQSQVIPPWEAPANGSGATPTPRLVATAVPTIQGTPVLQNVTPGQKMAIQFTNLPPNHWFTVGIGRTGQVYTVVTEGQSDANGNLQVEVMMSMGALPGESWTVTASLPTLPREEYTYGPILIAP